MSWRSSEVAAWRACPALSVSSVVCRVSWLLWYWAARNDSVAVLGYMSVAADLVTPSWLQVPKWARATASGQRSAAQNGQDSSLTNTMAGLPFTASGGPEEATWCSGVATRPGLTWLSTPSGTAATGRATAAGAADSLAVRWAGDLVRLTATSVAAMATTAVTEPSAISIRRRFSARLRAARSAAIRSRALGRRGGRDMADVLLCTGVPPGGQLHLLRRLVGAGRSGGRL